MACIELIRLRISSIHANSHWQKLLINPIRLTAQFVDLVYNSGNLTSPKMLLKILKIWGSFLIAAEYATPCRYVGLECVLREFLIAVIAIGSSYSKGI